MKKALLIISGAALGILIAAPASLADDAVDMHRLYNPNSGEHFYTAEVSEKDHLVDVGWNYEGIGWTAPAKSSTPVYRVYNPNAGDHHYTCDIAERDNLISLGWSDEGIGWYSNDNQTAPLYRQYNPNAIAGSHNYTTDASENDMLVDVGWNAEGIGWYGCTYMGEQGHHEDIYETVHISAVTHEEPVYTTIVDQEAYTTYTVVYYVSSPGQETWSTTDRDAARQRHIQYGGNSWAENVPEYHPAITHREQTGTTTVVDVPAHDEQRKIGTKWIVDAPAHWE